MELVKLNLEYKSFSKTNELESKIITMDLKQFKVNFDGFKDCDLFTGIYLFMELAKKERLDHIKEVKDFRSNNPKLCEKIDKLIDCEKPDLIDRKLLNQFLKFKKLK